MIDPVIRCVTAPLADDAWAGMTFPLYRRLLPLVGTGAPDEDGTVPTAVTATDDGQPVGLLLAGRAAAGATRAELLSVFVVADRRGCGLATAMMDTMETELAAAGVTEVSGVYMAGKAGTEALERVFHKRGFSAPTLRKVVAQGTAEAMSSSEWFRRVPLPPGSEVFSWVDLPAEEYEALQRSQDEHPWIPESLQPWKLGAHFDAVSSIGLRLNGEIVGWVVNHRVAPNLVRYTASFVRADLQRRAVLLPLIAASLTRLIGTGTQATSVTDAEFPEMMKFYSRRMRPYLTFLGETRGVTKHLGPPVPATGADV